VLTNVAELKGNPYLRLWGAAVRRSGARLAPLAPATVVAARAQRPAWVHLQWPERTVQAPGRRAAAQGVARLLALVAVARLRGLRVMVTAHNVWSHERRHPRLEPLLWTLLGLLATDLHVLTVAGAREFLASHRTFRRARLRVIPHVNYAPVVGEAPDRRAARERLGLPAGSRVLVAFGALKPYKGIEALLDAFAALADPDARLVVAGRVADPGLDARLAAAARADARIVLLTRFLDDEELATVIRAGDEVVLPYREVLNSGSALLALTLGRPVLLPRTATFAQLREQVGEAWVRLFAGAPTAADLAAPPVRPAPDAAPDLAWCSWERVGDALRELWREGVAR
jgi:beta-1,4-mannosyltransferase